MLELLFQGTCLLLLGGCQGLYLLCLVLLHLLALTLELFFQGAGLLLLGGCQGLYLLCLTFFQGRYLFALMGAQRFQLCRLAFLQGFNLGFMCALHLVCTALRGALVLALEYHEQDDSRHHAAHKIEYRHHAFHLICVLGCCVFLKSWALWIPATVPAPEQLREYRRLRLVYNICVPCRCLASCLGHRGTCVPHTGRRQGLPVRRRARTIRRPCARRPARPCRSGSSVLSRTGTGHGPFCAALRNQ